MCIRDSTRRSRLVRAPILLWPGSDGGEDVLESLTEGAPGGPGQAKPRKETAICRSVIRHVVLQPL
eukprot:537921-Alexandrium_andersonii.AAC.1